MPLALRRHSGEYQARFGPYLDLGSGGGLPGLVLGDLWPDCRFTLVDAGERRCDFLRSAVERCHFSDRFTVLHGRAEALGHEAALRGAFDGVVARSFGHQVSPPSVQPHSCTRWSACRF